MWREKKLLANDTSANLYTVQEGHQTLNVSMQKDGTLVHKAFSERDPCLQGAQFISSRRLKKSILFLFQLRRSKAEVWTTWPLKVS